MGIIIRDIVGIERGLIGYEADQCRLVRIDPQGPKRYEFHPSAGCS